MTKAEIISAIQRLAKDAEGNPPGSRTFSNATGLPEWGWRGKYWARWGDALRDAGFEPNTLNPAIEENQLLEKYARLAMSLSRLPGTSEVKLARQSDTDMPSWDAIKNRFGTKASLVRRLSEFCTHRNEFAAVQSMCEAYSPSRYDNQESSDAEPSTNSNIGYVYLMQHGNRREYKIGRTYNALRREGEIRIELPERIQPVHVIETDDPPGIEAYWHQRFAEKRKNGEWFALTSADVAAFRRRKFM